MNYDITPLHAIVLGLVQGLTEFIPVSSSAHLNITHWLFGQERELAFDVTLHVGTLVALAWYFRHDWKALIFDKTQAKLRNFVLLACVPAVFAGVFLRQYQDTPLFAKVHFNAIMLIVMGLVLLAADRTGLKNRELDKVTLKDSILVGLAQCIALVPGVSRSGSTITAGLFLGLNRDAAARFSFLISLPITVGAVAFEFYKDVYKAGGLHTLGAAPGTILLGVLVSFLSGFWAISFLLNFLKKHDVTLFVAWRIAAALAVFALLAAGFKE